MSSFEFEIRGLGFPKRCSNECLKCSFRRITGWNGHMVGWALGLHSSGNSLKCTKAAFQSLVKDLGAVANSPCEFPAIMRRWTAWMLLTGALTSQFSIVLDEPRCKSQRSARNLHLAAASYSRT